MSQSGNRNRGLAHHVLRVGTHNVRGMLSHVHQLVDVWQRLQLDVVLVQETWVSFWTRGEVEVQLNAACRQRAHSHPGFQVHWGYNLIGNAARSAGVAVLIRKGLCAAGQLVVREPQMVATVEGRFLKVPVEWGGHKLQLVSVYGPNDSVPQQQFKQ